MFHTISDFIDLWAEESTKTRAVMQHLTEDSLGQLVVPGGRTLGRLAWHLTVSLGELSSHLALPIDCPIEEGDVPPLETIRATHDRAAHSLADRVRQEWTDDKLEQVFEMYGEHWSGAFALGVLVRHEIHHRGQMTVLMRQAGLTVPGIYGPAREEWSQWGMAAPA